MMMVVMTAVGEAMMMMVVIVVITPSGLDGSGECECGEGHHRQSEFLQEVHTKKIGIERAIEWEFFQSLVRSRNQRQGAGISAGESGFWRKENRRGTRNLVSNGAKGIMIQKT